MTRTDDGFAGIAELAVALLLLGLLLPLVGVGLDNTWQLFRSLDARAVAGTDGLVLLSTAESQLQGAQPLGYCAAVSDPVGADGPAASIEVPVAACAETALGPPPPGGAPDWSGYVSALPSPSQTSCGTPELGSGALVTATATCIGFFSYDDEPSGSATEPGALAGSGPFTPPVLTYLWQCAGSCDGAGGTDGLWLTSYPATGGYTNAGCPSPDDVCANPDWATASAAQRYLGTVDGGGALFSYRDAAGADVAEDGTRSPPTVDSGDLPTVELVTVAVDVSAPGGATSTPSTSVPLTGNVYQSSTDGNG